MFQSPPTRSYIIVLIPKIPTVSRIPSQKFWESSTVPFVTATLRFPEAFPVLGPLGVLVHLLQEAIVVQNEFMNPTARGPPP